MLVTNLAQNPRLRLNASCKPSPRWSCTLSQDGEWLSMAKTGSNTYVGFDLGPNPDAGADGNLDRGVILPTAGTYVVSISILSDKTVNESVVRCRPYDNNAWAGNSMIAASSQHTANTEKRENFRITVNRACRLAVSVQISVGTAAKCQGLLVCSAADYERITSMGVTYFDGTTMPLAGVGGGL